jgi:hypothetical protein
MFRVDAQHSFAPPAQGPEWFGKILARNKFAASIYLPSHGSIDDAIALASQFPYIRRIVPTLSPLQLHLLPTHPLITSVRLSSPTPAALAELQRRRLAIEMDVKHWPISTSLPLALDGLPDDPDLPPNVFVKLTGFRLPLHPSQIQKLHKMFQNPGPSRLLFASAWPLPGTSWKETLAAFTQAMGPQSIDFREQILGRSACAFYGL